MDLFEFLAKVLLGLEQADIPYMVSGSLAAIYYGEPRFTNDVDIVAEVRPEQVAKLRELFPEEEFYFSEAMALDAIRRRGQFNIIHPSSGLKADIILVRDRQFSRTEFERRISREIAAGQESMMAMPEDVILMKMDYYQQGGSDKHLRDIAGIFQVSGEELDRSYLATWAGQLGLSELWEEILKNVEGPGESK